MRGKVPAVAFAVAAVVCLAGAPCWAQGANCQSKAGEDLQYYPSKAQAQGIEGSATIRCKVSGDGELNRCVVVHETPEGYCFGQAAVDMSVTLKLKQRPQNGVYETTIKFSLDKAGRPG